MKNWNLIYKSVIVLLLATVVVLAVLMMGAKKESKQLNQLLVQANEKIANDSFLLSCQERLHNDVIEVVSSYDNYGFFNGQEMNVSVSLDTLLKTYVSENDKLNQYAEKIKNRIRYIEKEVKILEKEKGYSEAQSFDLQSELIMQKEMLDSIYTELHELNLELSNYSIDSLRINSPKGHPILYFGKMKNKSPEGFGIGFYEGKGYYIGEWKGNLRSAKGKHFYKDGSKYDGAFENDIRQGFGTYYYPTGEVYKGYWKNDLMHGEGEIIGSDGNTIKGVWENGKLIQKTQNDK